MPRKQYDDGGIVASEILQQLGGMNRLKVMTGAYNFVNIGNGVSFKLKNPRANYVKIKLNSLDLYDLEVGRIRGDTYKIVAEHNNIYADQLKQLIEKATGLYLSLAKGGGIDSWIGSYKKPIKTSDVPEFLNSTKNDGHKYSLWNKSVGVTYAYNGKLYANNGQVLPKGTVIDLDDVMNYWKKNNCDTLFVEDEELIILPQKQDKYNCYTTGYDGMKNSYGNEDNVTLKEAVEFCWRYNDVRKKYETKEDLEKEINSTPYGENNIIASMGNITGVVVYKLATQQYAKGGELGIKNKLSKSSFSLPYQIAIYVPSTKDKDVVISKKELDIRVDEVKKYLAQLFGGFNSVKVEGGYQSQDKGLIKEDAVRVVAFGNKENIDENFKQLISKIKNWCSKWGQESIGLEFENDMFYIDQSSQFADGGGISDNMYQIKDTDTDKYYSLSMDGMPKWRGSPDMGYQYSMGEAENLKDNLLKIGYNVEIVKYNKDWWKYAKGGYVDLSKEKPSIMQDAGTFKVPEIDLIKIDTRKFEGRGDIRGSEDAVDIFRQFWNKNSLPISESLNVMFLNQANKVIGIYQHSKGSVNGTVADPEMIALVAVKSLAKGVILAHNHPSGNLKPSSSDVNIANKIKQGLKLFDINLLDSLIITEDSFNSMADSGDIMKHGGEVTSYDDVDRKIVLKAIKEDKFKYQELYKGLRADADVKYDGNIHTVTLESRGKSINNIEIDSMEIDIDIFSDDEKNILNDFFKDLRIEYKKG